MGSGGRRQHASRWPAGHVQGGLGMSRAVGAGNLLRLADDHADDDILIYLDEDLVARGRLPDTGVEQVR